MSTGHTHDDAPRAGHPSEFSPSIPAPHPAGRGGLWALVAVTCLALVFAAVVTTVLLLPASAARDGANPQAASGEPLPRATAYLRLEPYAPSVLSRPGQPYDADKFELFKKTQRFLVTSSYVLREALMTPTPDQNNIPQKPADLPLLKDREDMVGWLAENVKVSFPGDGQIMAISLDEENQEPAAMIVNAVTNAYVEEVFNAERRERNEQRLKLDQIQAEKDAELRRLRDQHQRLAIALGTGSREKMAAMQQMALEKLALLQEEFYRAESEAARGVAELEVQQSIRDGLADREVSFGEVIALIRSDPAAAAHYTRLYGELAQREPESVAPPAAETPPGSTPPDAPTAPPQTPPQLAKLQAEMDRLIARYAEHVRRAKQLECDAAVTRLRLQTDRLKYRADQLDAKVGVQEEYVNATTRSSIDYGMMTREIEQLQRILDELVTARQRIIADLEAPLRVSIVEPPLP